MTTVDTTLRHCTKTYIHLYLKTHCIRLMNKLHINLSTILHPHLGAFYFGSSLIVALVKRPPFYFFQMFPNFCVQVYSFGFAFRFRLRV